MTGSVGIVGSNQAAPQQSFGGPATSVAANQTADSNSVVKALTTRDSDPPISPRIVIDPLAGVITQFLTTSGQLQSQIPSAAVVAYLRAGLTSEGFAKPTPESQDTSKATHGNTGNDNHVVA